MTILVTGATGRVGSQVVKQLLKRGANVRVLVRDPSKADFPAGVQVVRVTSSILTHCVPRSPGLARSFC